MPAGRPSKFNKETPKKSLAYIASCKDNKGSEKEVNLPTAEGLALWLKVSRDTLYEWARRHKEFSYILEALNQEQSRRLINNGLSGFYNSNIAKLVLAKHGYKDQSDITSGNKPLNISFDPALKDASNRTAENNSSK